MKDHKFNFELIVVNDGSKDDTGLVLKQLTLKILRVREKILNMQLLHLKTVNQLT